MVDVNWLREDILEALITELKGMSARCDKVGTILKVSYTYPEEWDSIRPIIMKHVNVVNERPDMQRAPGRTHL